jgi:2-methylcitrate dehydratase PrpD
MAESLSRTLSRFSYALDYQALPPQVIDKIKASLLHGLIIAIVGADTGHGKAAIGFAKTEEPKADGATILVDGSRATRSGAVFANS